MIDYILAVSQYQAGIGCNPVLLEGHRFKEPAMTTLPQPLIDAVASVLAEDVGRPYATEDYRSCAFRFLERALSRLPSVFHGYAMHDAQGRLMVNSVRADRQATRLAAGESPCVPVVVLELPR